MAGTFAIFSVAGAVRLMYLIIATGAVVSVECQQGIPAGDAPVFLSSGQTIDQESLSLLQLKRRSIIAALRELELFGVSEDESKEQLWVAKAEGFGAFELQRRLADEKGIEFLSALPDGYAIIRGSKHDLREILSAPWLETLAELPPQKKYSPQIIRLPDVFARAGRLASGEIKSQAGDSVGITTHPRVLEENIEIGVEVWLFDSSVVNDFLSWMDQRGLKGHVDPDFERMIRISLLPLSELENIAEQLAVERIALANSMDGFSEISVSGSTGELCRQADSLVPAPKILLGRVPGIFPYAGPLNGLGEKIGHADTGIDSGADKFHRHPDLKGIFKGSNIHPTLSVDSSEGWADRSGHGTHTAGLIIGDGSASQSRILGVAPGAQLIHHSLGTADALIDVSPQEFLDSLSDSMNEGARIHSDSWGKRFGDYGILSEALDRWTWGGGSMKDLLVVVAAGNERRYGLNGSLSDPAAAKNVLTVGAVDLETGKIEPYSSGGLTRDGRSKPDLVAPGNWLISTRPRFSLPWVKDTMDVGTFLHWKQVVQEGAQEWGATEAGREGPGLTDSPSGDYANNVTTMLVSQSFSPDVRSVKFWARWDVPEEEPFGLQIKFGTEGKTYPLLSTRLIPQNPSWPDGDWVTIPVPSFVRDLSWPSWQINFELTTDKSVTGDGITIDDFELSAWQGCTLFEQNIEPVRFGDLDLTAVRPQRPEASSALETFYFVESGTSMAAALVSGLAARYRQFLKTKRDLPEPSPQALKAALINGTVRPSTVPDPELGWGVASMKFTEMPGIIYDRRVLAASRATFNAFFEVKGADLSLRATLVWWDAEGANLINDLDLVLVSASGKEISAGEDRRNTVEDIEVVEPEPGLWRVEVQAHRIAKGRAEFALALSGNIKIPEEQVVQSEERRDSNTTGHVVCGDFRLDPAPARPLGEELCALVFGRNFGGRFLGPGASLARCYFLAAPGIVDQPVRQLCQDRCGNHR